MATVIVYRSRSASYAAKRVAAAASGLRAVQQDSYHPQRGDVVVRWDCHDGLDHEADTVDINPLDAVRLARDKHRSREVLAELAPPTWFARPDVQPPCVVRPRRHKAGARFFVCGTHPEVAAATRKCGTGWYASSLIQKQREFRVFVVQGRVVAVSERFPGNDHTIAWNLALGGRLINVGRKTWPVEVLRVSLEAMTRLGLGFGAVDACLDRDGRAWVFEANTSPALRNKFTIRQIARALSKAGTAPPPVKDGAKKTKSYAHPAILRGEA